MQINSICYQTAGKLWVGTNLMDLVLMEYVTNKDPGYTNGIKWVTSFKRG